MEQNLIEAIKSNDLVKAKKAFGAIMPGLCAGLIESRKLVIAKSVLIEGEEKDQEEDNAEEKKALDKTEDNEKDSQEADDEDDDEEEEE